MTRKERQRKKIRQLVSEGNQIQVSQRDRSKVLIGPYTYPRNLVSDMILEGSMPKPEVDPYDEAKM